jgi:hypothetical protein
MKKATVTTWLASYNQQGSEANVKGRFLFSFALAVILLVPSVAQAQRGARFVSAPPSASVRRSSAIVRTGPRTGRRSAFTPVNRISANGNGLTSIYPGMGLGINGINSILTQNNLGVEAAIDPATQWNLALVERLNRSLGGIFSGGGYYFLSGGGAYVVPAEPTEVEQPLQQQQQPQVIVVQQGPAQQSVAQSVEEPVMPPLPDVGQFTLILQDGKQIQAVAFTHMNDRIIYITSDGSRRTIALSALDTDATVRVNQERGTPLQLPL